MSLCSKALGTIKHQNYEMPLCSKALGTPKHQNMNITIDPFAVKH